MHIHDKNGPLNVAKQRQVSLLLLTGCMYKATRHSILIMPPQASEPTRDAIPISNSPPPRCIGNRHHARSVLRVVHAIFKLLLGQAIPQDDDLFPLGGEGMIG